MVSCDKPAENSPAVSLHRYCCSYPPVNTVVISRHQRKISFRENSSLADDEKWIRCERIYFAENKCLLVTLWIFRSWKIWHHRNGWFFCLFIMIGLFAHWGVLMMNLVVSVSLSFPSLDACAIENLHSVRVPSKNCYSLFAAAAGWISRKVVVVSFHSPRCTWERSNVHRTLISELDEQGWVLVIADQCLLSPIIDGGGRRRVPSASGLLCHM